MATDPALAGILQQYMSQGAGTSSATPGSGPTSQQYWPGTKTSKSANGVYKVYMGKEAPANMLSSLTGQDNNTLPDYAKVGEKDKTMTESQAIASMANWSPEELSKWKDTLVHAGLLKPGKNVTYAQLQAQWANAVQDAAQAYTVSGKQVTPYDIVDIMGTVNGAGGTTGGLAAGSVPGGTKQTETDRTVDHVSNEEASQILRNAFEQAVGRAPTDTEVEEFANRLHTAIRQNPTVTKTTATMDANGNVTRNVDSEGGFGSGGVGGFANSMAQQDAMADPEYGAYQASTTYFSALLNAIKSPT